MSFLFNNFFERIDFVFGNQLRFTISFDFSDGYFKSSNLSQLIRKVIEDNLSQKTKQVQIISMKFQVRKIVIEVKKDRSIQFSKWRQLLTYFKQMQTKSICLQKFIPKSLEEKEYLLLQRCIQNSNKELILVDFNDKILNQQKKIIFNLSSRSRFLFAIDHLKKLKAKDPLLQLFNWSVIGQNLQQQNTIQIIDEIQIKLQLKGPILTLQRVQQIMKEIKEQEYCNYYQEVSATELAFIKQKKQLPLHIFNKWNMILTTTKINSFGGVRFKTNYNKNIELVCWNTISFQVITRNSWLLIPKQIDTKMFQKSILKDAFVQRNKNSNIINCQQRKIKIFLWKGQIQFQKIIINLQKNTSFFIFMEQFSDIFFQQLITVSRQSKMHIRIVVLCTNLMALKVLKYFQAPLIFNVQQFQNEIPYFEVANKKIIQALRQKQIKITLTNQDFNIARITHKCNLMAMTIKHNLNQKDIPLVFIEQRISYQIKQQIFDLPASQAKLIKYNMNKQSYKQNKKQNIFKRIFQKFFFVQTTNKEIDLSVGNYLVDLVNLVQINRFTDFKRDIQFRISKSVSKNFISESTIDLMKLSYIPQLQDSLHLVLANISDFFGFNQSRISFLVPPNFTAVHKQKIEQILKKGKGKKYQIKQNAIDLYGYQEENASVVVFAVQSLISNISSYIIPIQWTPQEQYLQLATVDSKSAEFIKVETQFAVQKIHKLVRIQNRIIYSKYQQQLQTLTELNKGKVPKEMRLFHGTRGTLPELIYADKQEAFNVNYSRDTNLLGCGVYFAQKAAYSVNYKHQTKQRNQNNQTLYSMFLCTVIVGDSQVTAPGNNGIKDTNFKDQANKIRYESNTAFLQGSNVFVVYKNRRAYPLYLITFKLPKKSN